MLISSSSCNLLGLQATTPFVTSYNTAHLCFRLLSSVFRFPMSVVCFPFYAHSVKYLALSASCRILVLWVDRCGFKTCAIRFVPLPLALCNYERNIFIAIFDVGEGWFEALYLRAIFEFSAWSFGPSRILISFCLHTLHGPSGRAMT